MRWNKRFDGTKESLRDQSHRPKTIHPNSHTQKELDDIKNLIRRNPNATMIEIYAKLKFNKDYKRHPCSLFRILRKLGYFKDSKKKLTNIFLRHMIPLKKQVKNGNQM